MRISFETIAQQVGMEILQITENGIVIAKGICIPEAVTSFCDNNTSINCKNIMYRWNEHEKIRTNIDDIYLPLHVWLQCKSR